MAYLTPFPLDSGLFCPAPPGADASRAALLRSRERSLGFGIRTGEARLCNTTVTRGLSQRVREEHRELLSFVQPEMDLVYRAIADARWSVVCANAEGVVVDYVGDYSRAPQELRVVLSPGRRLAEEDIGTSAPGCALLERRPIAVAGAEHYLDETRDFVCAAAPVFDPSGRVVAVFDITGFQPPERPGGLDMVTMAACSVENRMVLALPEALLMRLHFREEMLGTPGEAILAFDAEGCLLGANQAARRFFALPDGQPLAGGFAALFDCDFRRVAGLPRRDAAAYLSLRCRNGVALFGRVEWSKGRAASAVPAARPLLPRRSAATAAPEFWLDPSLELVLDKAQRALSRNLPVLVSGETGTGKEVVARTLHQRCHGADAPFVAVNCASVPEGLIESELFGYVDGAFSGARRGGAMGKLEQANGGTLFLDEIGDMPLGLQARLLRVLQERVVTRLGAAKPTKLHFSLICATHRELRERVASGDFREDLYYRISGLNIALPALRAGRDVDGLIGHLLAREAERWGVMRLHPAARSLLLAYSWPGNVRELAHVLRSAAALAADECEISVWHLPEDLVQAAQAALADGGEDGCSVGLPTLQELEAVAIRQAFAAHRGNISAAARSLGISRVTLYDKLRRLGLITLAN